jgi:uncharacterized Zn finger protein
MATTDVEVIETALRKRWSFTPSVKAKGYVGKFVNATRTGKKITAQVEGNHGRYTVSIEAEPDSLTSACSCYIGKGGFCHHCEALAHTFLEHPRRFKAIKSKKLQDVKRLDQLSEPLRATTLDALLKELKARGVSQKAVAESIGMNPRHLGAIKSSELRNRYYNELGATKLACLWVLEHLPKKKR